jgi:hypothetical protein
VEIKSRNSCIMTGGPSTRVVQVTNIAPQATKDYMVQLFQLLGKIEDIRLCEAQLTLLEASDLYFSLLQIQSHEMHQFQQWEEFAI